jgi:hypothetical protein
MASLNVVRVDFAQARTLRAGRARGRWRYLRTASPSIVPSLSPPLSPLLAHLLARYRARRASAVERILRKGIASLE